MTLRSFIDVNCDLGESPSDIGIAHDIKLLRYVSSVSVACGGHAGDADTMRKIVAAAHQSGVSIGAHPSYPDRDNFGRSTIQMGLHELEASIHEQLQAILAVARSSGAILRHVKPHGALYHDAAQNAAIAEAVLSAIARCGIDAAVFAPPGSALSQLAPHFQFTPRIEAFADRRYQADGSLCSRKTPGAVIEDPNLAAAQALSLVRDGVVRSIDGATLRIHADTICVHSDTPNALQTLQAVHGLLEASNIAVRASHGGA